MSVNLKTVARRLRLKFPDAAVEVEDYNASQWLNMTVGGRLFTVEARRSRDNVGFSEISEQADFGGHDETYPYEDAGDLSNKLIRVIGQKIDRPVIVRSRRPSVATQQGKVRSRASRPTLTVGGNL